jgi:hypothetical protein
MTEAPAMAADAAVLASRRGVPSFASAIVNTVLAALKGNFLCLFIKKD